MGESVLCSLKQYLNMLKSDFGRDVSVIKKLLFESLTGPMVREHNLMTRLSEKIGARKNSIFDSAARRVKLESDNQVLSIVSRLQRKSPMGDRYISNLWKAEAYGLYENHIISDVIKGVNNVHKVMQFLNLTQVIYV